MNLAQALDLSIKEAETQGTKKDKFYKIGDRRYYNYVDNESWKAFVDEMKVSYTAIYKNYVEGSGDELGVKRVGIYPPKMASYGSSSRMIYFLARKIPGFKFEKKLYTTVGGTANMDGFVSINGKDIYIEAKCREPYGSHNATIDRKYEDLYRFFNERPDLPFKCEITILDEKEMKVKFISKGNTLKRFDIKQMICHLLGIATEKLTTPSEDKVVFKYLLFNPTEIAIEDTAWREKLTKAYRQETDECDSVPFAELYKVIITFLTTKTTIKASDKADIDSIANNFEFSRCDQITFAEQLK